MDTHPIPQNISSYQFRLVGDMTLKQFFQIAGGAVVSLIIYSTNLYPLIKWPLILFFALLGVALAFLPFQERPLERWIIAFFRSVYSPTIFNWQKPAKANVFFQEEAPVPQEKVIFPGGEAKLQEYLSSIAKDAASGKLEKNESSFLLNLTGLLLTLPQEKAPETLEIPTQAPPVIEKASPLKLVVEETGPEGIQKQTVSLSPVTLTPPSQEPFAQKQAVFSLDAAPPNPPSIPNTLAGQVVDTNRKIIEGAIMEIRSIAGRPVRVFKSNKLGHFTVVTPLSSGQYEIITEKDGYEFEPLAFEANGTIIPPIAITGRLLAQPTAQPTEVEAVKAVQVTKPSGLPGKLSEYPWQ